MSDLKVQVWEGRPVGLLLLHEEAMHIAVIKIALRMVFICIVCANIMVIDCKGAG